LPESACASRYFPPPFASSTPPRSGWRQAALDDGPPPVPGGRPKGCKRLHTNATVAKVRPLFEDTTLTYKQIAAKTNFRQRLGRP
jgi:hypothetical protein